MGLNALLDCEMVEGLTPNPISQIEAAMATVTHPLKKGYRTLRLPLAESEYDHFLSDRIYAKTRLDELYEEFPEVFPDAFPWGYALYGFTEPSITQECAVDAFVSIKVRRSLRSHQPLSCPI
jgi:hypothetical protein